MPVLERGGIARNFGAIQALTSLDPRIEAGRASGPMGGNGAGNSTLIKIIAVNRPPPSGEVRLDNEPVRLCKSTNDRSAAGDEQ